MNTTILLLAWWVFVAVIGYALFAFMRMLSNPKYRTGAGDISTEVGYTTDPYGAARQQEANTGSDSGSAVEEVFTQAAGHSGGPGV
jgi:hypothetical protein